MRLRWIQTINPVWKLNNFFSFYFSFFVHCVCYLIMMILVILLDTTALKNATKGVYIKYVSLYLNIHASRLHAAVLRALAVRWEINTKKGKKNQMWWKYRYISTYIRIYLNFFSSTRWNFRNIRMSFWSYLDKIRISFLQVLYAILFVLVFPLSSLFTFS